jgi:hypothetical protein
MADIRADDRLYAVCGSRSSIGTTELPVVYFRNPSGSSRTVKIRQIIANNSHTVSSGIRFRVYVNPTVSANGTALTEVALDIGSGNTPSADAFSSPTVSANGSQIADLSAAAFLTSTSVNLVPSDGLQLRANNTILITAVADGSSRVANITIWWEED